MYGSLPSQEGREGGREEGRERASERAREGGGVYCVSSDEDINNYPVLRFTRIWYMPSAPHSSKHFKSALEIKVAKMIKIEFDKKYGGASACYKLLISKA